MSVIEGPDERRCLTMRQLTPKQNLFVLEYLTDLNATRSAIAAGYSRKGARQQGSQLLSNINVSAAISEKARKRFEKLEITADRVLNELALLAFSNMMDYLSITGGAATIDLSNLTREQAAAIQEITVEEYVERTGGASADGDDDFERVKRTKFKLSDKRSSLELLGRHLKLFTDRVEVEGDVKVDVQDVKRKLIARLAGRTVAGIA